MPLTVQRGIRRCHGFRSGNFLFFQIVIVLVSRWSLRSFARRVLLATCTAARTSTHNFFFLFDFFFFFF